MSSAFGCSVGRTFFSHCDITKRTLTVGGRITECLVSSLTRLDLTKEETMLLFVCCEAVESKLVKVETVQGCIMKLSPIVSVFCTWLHSQLVASSSQKQKCILESGHFRKDF